jgi:hypothetical protein
MALNKAKLLDDLKNLPPSDNLNVASTNLAKAFTDYYMTATVADTIPTIPPLDVIFLSTLTNNTWIQTLGVSLQSWFALFVWASPAFSGPPGATIALGPALDASMSAFVLKTLADKSDPPIDNLPEFVDIVDVWSKTIVVSLINVATAAPVPVLMV